MSQNPPPRAPSTGPPLFSKILVAIDGSRHSFKAAKYALDLANSSGAQIYAITITSIPESYHLKEEDVLNNSRKKTAMVWKMLNHGLITLINKQKKIMFNYI